MDKNNLENNYVNFEQNHLNNTMFNSISLQCLCSRLKV